MNMDNPCCFNAEGVAEELMFQSATPVLSKIFLKEITIFFASY